MKVTYTYDRKRRSVAVEEARVYLSDESTHYGGGSDNYNHPQLHLRVRGAITTTVELRYQRHIPADAASNGRTADVTWARTDLWSESYGGRVELSHDARTHDISDRPYRLSHVDTMRVAVARHLARLDSERCQRKYHAREAGNACNAASAGIERDELERHVAALREAGVPVIAMRYVRAGKCECIELPRPESSKDPNLRKRELALEVW